MLKRISAAIAAFLFLFSVLPLSSAKTADTRYTTPSGYAENDYQKLVAFYETEDSGGVKNGAKLRSDYSPYDPATWKGATWTAVGGINYLSDFELYFDRDYHLAGAVDVSGCTKLTFLYVYLGSHSSVDASGCTALTSFACNGSGTESVNISGCTELTQFRCFSNRLTSLDLSGFSKLTYIGCDDNLLTSLDVSGCTELTDLHCCNNLLTSLDLTDCTKLSAFTCSGNPLKLLDMSNNPCLKLDRLTASGDGTIGCYDFSFSGDEAKVYAVPDEGCELEGWYSGDTLLSQSAEYDVTAEDVTELTARFSESAPVNEDGYCGNDYEKICAFLELEDENGVKNGTRVNSDYVPGDMETVDNKIYWSEIGGVKYVTYVMFDSCCLIGSLDLSGCEHLVEADCRSNRMDCIDVSGCVELTTLNCSNNTLTSLDVSGCTKLESINCQESGLVSLDASGLPALRSVSCGRCSGLTALDVSGCTALTDISASYSALTELGVTGCTALETLWCTDCDLTSLDLSSCEALSSLYCSRNELTELDVSGCAALEAAWCDQNELPELDVSGLTALKYLYCNKNALTSLDLSGCTALDTLQFGSNPLTTVDVSDCTELDTLNCYDGRLTSVDMTNNPKLKLDLLTAGEGGAFAFCDRPADSGSGRTVILFAHPADGAEFIGWYDENGVLLSSDLEFDVSDMDVSVLRAEFDLPMGVPEITLSSVASTGKVKVTWAAVEDAAKYEVWRCTQKNGSYIKAKTTTALTYTNTGAESGDKYWYKVRAVAEDGTAGEFCSPKYRYTHLPQPDVTGAHVASTGKNKLTWEAVGGAVSYEVWRSSEKTSGFKKMKTTENLSYVNTGAKPGEKWYYKVVAVHSVAAADSAASAVKTLTCDLERPVVSIALDGGKPKLTWDAVSGAEGYEVWRREGSSGDYKLIKTVTKTSFKNTGAAAGTTYYYKVIAVHCNTAANSAFSAAVHIKSK